MLGLGNTAANKIWEFNLNSKNKPSPSSSNEEKEKFIRAKYEAKEYLCPLSDTNTSLEQQIIDAILQMNIKQLAHVLAHASRSNVNLSFVHPRENKTPLHLAASKGCLEITQLLLWVCSETFFTTSAFSNIFMTLTHTHSTMRMKKRLTPKGKLPSTMREFLATKRSKNC